MATIDELRRTLIELGDRSEAEQPNPVLAYRRAAEEARRSSHPRPLRRLTLAAVAVAFVVVAIALLVQRPADDTIRNDEPTSSLITTPSPPSSVDAHPDSADAEATTGPELPPSLSKPMSGETQRTVVGDITWTRVEGDPNTQPATVVALIDGTFYGTADPGEDPDVEQIWWSSRDGVSWTRLADDPDVGSGEAWEIQQLGETGGPALVRWDGAAVEPVAVPDRAPTIDGLRRRSLELDPEAVLGDELVIVASTHYELPWSDLYELPAGRPTSDENWEACWGPGFQTQWDATERTLLLSGSESDCPEPIAKLRAESTPGDPARLEFRDVETDDVVFGYELPAGAFPDEMFLTRSFDGGFVHRELLIGDADGFEVVPSPWGQRSISSLVALDERLLALVSLQADSGSGVELWASSDARTWEQLELPESIGHDVEYASIVASRGSAILSVDRGSPDDPSDEETIAWITEDGTTWAALPDATVHAEPRPADFGWTRDLFDESGAERSGLAVSADGRNWQDIDFGPAGSIEDPGGIGATDVLATTIFVQHSNSDVTRTMWVGVVDAG